MSVGERDVDYGCKFFFAAAAAVAVTTCVGWVLYKSSVRPVLPVPTAHIVNIAQCVLQRVGTGLFLLL